MDYSGNKTAVGQDRAISETESIVSMNLSKDGKTLDLTATYLKEYGAKDISKMESLRAMIPSSKYLLPRIPSDKLL